MKNIEKYLEDKQFIEWVFNPGDEQDTWWNAHEAPDHLEWKSINLARQIIRKLQTRNRELPENEKIVLFARILKEVEEPKQHKKIRRIIPVLLKYAAVAILFFSIGALLFYRNDNFYPQYAFMETSEPVYEGEARIIRPGGESILLSDQNSKIEHRQDGQVVVNNYVVESECKEEKRTPGINQLVIPYGNVSELLLPDGTKVWLNAGSRLVYPDFFVDKTREVFLAGEAFFDVEHDKSRPFVVQTTDIRVRVLGTRFNISAYPAEDIIETVLDEGRVRLEQNSSGLFNETIEISPGQMAAFSKSERHTSLKEVNVEHYTLWTDGLLKFESTDLSRVIKRLERHYNIRFKYQDPFLGGIKISGKLELSDSSEDVLKNVARAGSVHIQRIGKNFYEISR